MPHYYPVVLPGGKSLAGDSLGFHAYSLRIDNLTNQWLLEETSLAWIPPYSLGVCLRLYGTGVGIILNQAPIGQPQLSPITGEQAVGVYSDQIRTEVAGSPVRQYSLVQSVSDLTQGAQPALPPVSVDRLWADNQGNIHHLHSNGTDLILADANMQLGGVLNGTLPNPNHSTGPHDFPALIRTTGLGNYNSGSGAGMEFYYSPPGSGGNGYIQCYDRSSGTVARDIYVQGLANLRLNPNGYTYITRANFQSNILTNGYAIDQVLCPDWIRPTTAGYGIYNNASAQGIGFNANGAYDYQTGKTLAKLPIQQADIAATQISWDKTVAPNQAAAFTYIGGNEAAPSGSSTSTSYVFVPAPFNGVSVDIRRGSGLAIVDGIFHITCNTGTTVSIAYAWDGGGLTTIFANGVPASATTIPFSFYTSVSGWGAGAHTLQFYWATNGGTLTWRTDVYSWCRVWEQRA